MFPAGFDPQPALSSPVLRLRPLCAGDLDGLYKAASAPETWAGHPAKDRHERRVFEDYFAFLADSATTLVAIDRHTEAIIGCSRYYEAPDQPGSISIGFTFLDHRYWGGATNFEMKRLMLDHAFQHAAAVWFHIAPSNIRSQKATMKLGATHVYDATLDLSGTASPWMCFRLDPKAWAATCAGR